MGAFVNHQISFNLKVEKSKNTRLQPRLANRPSKTLSYSPERIELLRFHFSEQVFRAVSLESASFPDVERGLDGGVEIMRDF